MTLNSAERPVLHGAMRDAQLIPELLHAMSQPLTALRCSLELALYEARDVDAPPENLRLALRQAEQISQLASGIRELLEAEHPGKEQSVVALADCLRETVRDLLPLAEAAQVELVPPCGPPCRVRAEPRRLRQAIFYLLEEVLANAALGGSVRVEIEEQRGEALVLITAQPAAAAAKGEIEVNGELARDRELGRRLGLAMAARIFEAAGGGLAANSKKCGQLQLRLPLASSASATRVPRRPAGQ